MIFRILIIIVTTIAGYYLIDIGVVFYWPVMVGILLAIEVLEFLWYQKKIERSVLQFFRSIRNDDHAFQFNADGKSALVRQSHSEMNRVNELVKELKIEQEARERYYQILLEKVSTGILTINEKGIVEQVNHAALKTLRITVLHHIDQLERIDLRLFNHLKNQEPKERILISLLSGHGSLDISVITQKIQVREEALFIVILQDIRTELDQKELDAWIKLIRVQAHEIRNSLAPIASIAESMGKRVTDPEIKEGLDIILERSTHLRQFIDSYRQLTHLPPPEPSTFDLVGLFDRVKILLSDLPNFQEVKFNIESLTDNFMIKVDPNQLTQVILNILRNAYYALENIPDPTVNIQLLKTDQQVEILIKDNGKGIPENLLSEIFVPFFTTKEQGTGIGLSLSKQIIRKHGGEIFAQDNSNGGAIFRIILPR